MITYNNNISISRKEIMKTTIITAILMIIILTTTPHVCAQSDIGLKAIGVKLGYIDPENIDGTFGFGAIADLGALIPQLGLEAEFTYWSKNSHSDIAILTTAKYSFPVPESKFAPYTGGGLGLHFFSNGNSKTKLGFHILGGTDIRIDPQLTGFGEMRYCMVSDINKLWLFAGIKYKLGIK